MTLEMQGIFKSFGANDVLKNINFSIAGGEISALLGENGAGKSTLMNILGGVISADAGTLTMDGKPLHFRNPTDSLSAGIAFIHQELNLVNDLAVYENMFIGRELKKRFGMLDAATMCDRCTEIFQRMEIDLDPRTMVRDLDASYKQIVEIARALLMEASVIIMDEPTTSLTEPEIQRVFEMMRTLQKQGVAIVFISHKLREVMEICTRYTVLRDGSVVANGLVSETSVDELARHMVGHDVRTESLRTERELGEEVLRVTGLSQEGSFQDISFSLRAGVGLYRAFGRRQKRAVPDHFRQRRKIRRGNSGCRHAGRDPFHAEGNVPWDRLCAAQPQGKRHHCRHEHIGERLHRHLGSESERVPVGLEKNQRRIFRPRGISPNQNGRGEAPYRQPVRRQSAKGRAGKMAGSGAEDTDF